VKAAASSMRGDDIWLEVSQYETATHSPPFFLYLVETSAPATLRSSRFASAAGSLCGNFC